MYDKTLIADSDLLYDILTESYKAYKCELDSEGYIDINTLCRNSKYTMSYLELIESEDTRFEFSKNKKGIRVRSGNSCIKFPNI